MYGSPIKVLVVKMTFRSRLKLPALSGNNLKAARNQFKYSAITRIRSGACAFLLPIFSIFDLLTEQYYHTKYEPYHA